MYLHTYIRGRTADLSPLLDMYSKYEDTYIVACRAGMRTLPNAYVPIPSGMRTRI